MSPFRAKINLYYRKCYQCGNKTTTRYTFPMRTSSKIMGSAILVLLVISILIWSADLHADRRGLLTVSFLQAGKSGAVFIIAPSGRTVLIDGGSDASILRSLGAQLPWYERSIDVVIAAHPDAAHATGLIDVLQRYQVSNVFTSSAQGSGPVWATFEHSLTDAEKKGTRIATIDRGQVIDLGSTGSPRAAHAYIEILFPDRDLSSAPASVGCIEMQLVYGATSFMLSCGNAAVENYLVRLDGSKLRSDVLSVDSGKSASSSPLFSGFVGAQYVAQSGMTFVSDGKAAGPI